MNTTAYFPEYASHAQLGVRSVSEESTNIPELHLSDNYSSGSNSQLPSPENHANLSSQVCPISQPAKELVKLGHPETSFGKHKLGHHRHHPYTRIPISDLVNPLAPEPVSQEPLRCKKRPAEAPTLEQSVRHGLQMVQHQRKIESTSNLKSNSLASCLVDLSVLTIEAVWGAGVGSSAGPTRKALHHYVTELFRRSQVPQAVVQFAIIYCLRVKDTVSTSRKLLSCRTGSTVHANAAFCGRRMFLASLICASKYLLDSNFSNKVWAKFVGLSPFETSLTESSFLRLLDYKLYVREPHFYPYSKAVINFTLKKEPVSRHFQQLVESFFKKEAK